MFNNLYIIKATAGKTIYIFIVYADSKELAEKIFAKYYGVDMHWIKTSGKISITQIPAEFGDIYCVNVERKQN